MAFVNNCKKDTSKFLRQNKGEIHDMRDAVKYTQKYDEARARTNDVYAPQSNYLFKNEHFIKLSHYAYTTSVKPFLHLTYTI